jgi:ferredoxin-nitrate reductase
VLPAAQWGEKAGTMTNSERRVSLVEKVVEPAGEARADWKIFAEVARRMGFGESFAWRDESEVFDEFKELTRGTPADMTGLSRERLRERPVQWPVPEDLETKERLSGGVLQLRYRENEHPGTPRLYVDGKFNTPDGKARFTPTPARGPARATHGRVSANALDRACKEPVAHDDPDRPLGEAHARSRRAVRRDTPGGGA